MMATSIRSSHDLPSSRQNLCIRGYTLIEMLAAIAVMAILAGIAFPALGSMVAGNDLNTAQKNIIETLKKARGMAVSHSTIATVFINSAARTLQLSVADNSLPPETITLRPRVKIAADSVLSFSAQGILSVVSGGSTITLSAPGYTTVATRTINITPAGIVNDGR